MKKILQTLTASVAALFSAGCGDATGSVPAASDHPIESDALALFSANTRLIFSQGGVEQARYTLVGASELRITGNVLTAQAIANCGLFTDASGQKMAIFHNETARVVILHVPGQETDRGILLKNGESGAVVTATAFPGETCQHVGQRVRNVDGAYIPG